MLPTIRPTHRSFFHLIVLAALLSVGAAHARPIAPSSPASSPAAVRPAGTCNDGTQQSGALYRICMPNFFPWNTDLIVFAHGYIAPQQPLHIPMEQLTLADGTSIPDAVNLLGYAFATTSYSTNGLAIRQGLADVVDLVSVFRAQHPTLQRVLLVGVSEGGLITALAAEQYPQVFSGGLAACGPVGSFSEEIRYLGDFRVLFDYFFPGLIPGSPINVPPSLQTSWDSYYQNTVLPRISSPTSSMSVTQLLATSQAAYDSADPAGSISNTIKSALSYNIVGTADNAAKLGGQPFNNVGRVYSGSSNDTQLNARVQRFSATPAATAQLASFYETFGLPGVPLVTLHTTLDPVVPYAQETIYRAKVVAHKFTPRHDNIAVQRYGHCNFNQGEVQSALQLLDQRVNNPPPFPSDPLPFHTLLPFVQR